jgi:hypothetical protein
MERIFDVSSWLVLPVWAAMIVVPRWRWTRRVVASPAVSALPALLYVILITPVLPTVLPLLARPTLGQIAALLGTPEGATIAWAHFLAFDLFVARWIYLDASERAIPAVLVSGLLVATLLVGPIGYLAYLGVRSRAAAPVAARAREAAAWLDARSPLLWRASLAFGVLYVVYLALIPFDARTVLGLNPWVKPSKFAVSIAIYLATMAWFAAYLDRGRRRFVSLSLVLAMVIEIVLITLQAARGQASHFNQATPFDAVVFATMGVVITYAAAVAVYVLVRLVREPPAALPRPVVTGIWLGLVVFLVANVEGAVMVAHLAHTVGAPDGGPGLPYLNWSTAAGDLRVAHFVGMHALQALPLAGLAFAALERRGALRSAAAATWVAAAVYMAVVVALAVAAFAGVPVVPFARS